MPRMVAVPSVALEPLVLPLTGSRTISYPPLRAEEVPREEDTEAPPIGGTMTRDGRLYTLGEDGTWTCPDEIEVALRDYTIPEMSARDMLALQSMKYGYDTEADAELRSTFRSEYDVYSRALSPEVLRQIMADGVSARDMARASRTAQAYAASFADMARVEAEWSGKALTLEQESPSGS